MLGMIMCLDALKLLIFKVFFIKKYIKIIFFILTLI